MDFTQEVPLSFTFLSIALIFVVIGIGVLGVRISKRKLDKEGR